MLCKKIIINGEIKIMNCEEVYLKFKNLIYKISSKYYCDYIDFKDILQTANIGLIKAFNSYDYKKNIYFSSFMGVVIKNEILQFLRSEKRKYINNLEMYKSYEQIYNEDFFRNLDENNLKYYICKLKERDKLIVKMYFYDNLTHEEIGKKLNCCQANVSKILRRIINKIRKEIT